MLDGNLQQQVQVTSSTEVVSQPSQAVPQSQPQSNISSNNVVAPEPKSEGFSRDYSQPKVDNNTKEIVAGGVKLVIDELTGKRKIVSINNPQSQQQQVPDVNSVIAENQEIKKDTGNGSDVNPQSNVGLIGALNPENPPVSKENVYTAQELLVAMQLNAIDEARIPEHYREKYAEYKAEQEQIKSSRAKENPEEVINKRKEASEFYGRVNLLAEDMALRDLGITKEELDMSEFTDDEEMRQKLESYKAAVEFNRNKIFNDVQQEKQRQEHREREKQSIYSEIVEYTNKAKSSEPNFEAIDKLMLSRVNNLPYAEAVKIVPLLKSLQDGSIKREQLPELQKYYEDTRVEYYSQKTGVNRFPTQKPPVVENSGTGSNQETIDYKKLRGLRGKEQVAYLSQFLNR